MDPCLKELLTSTISVAKVTGYKRGGGEVLGAARTVKAYIEVENRRQATGDGDEKVNTTIIITEDELFYDERIWLPGTTVNTADPKGSFKPDTILKFNDVAAGGVSHFETSLG